MVGVSYALGKNLKSAVPCAPRIVQVRLAHGAFRASVGFMTLIHHLFTEGVEISNYNCGFACFLVLVLVFAPGILSSVIGCVNIKRRQSAKELMLLTVVLEKTLESPLDCKEIKPVSLKGNQPWILTGRTDAEAEAPILQPPDAKT